MHRNVIKSYPEEIHRALAADLFTTVLLAKYDKARYLPNIRPAIYRQHSGDVWSGLNREDQQLATLDTILGIYQYHARESAKKWQFAISIEPPFRAWRKCCRRRIRFHYRNLKNGIDSE